MSSEPDIHPDARQLLADLRASIRPTSRFPLLGVTRRMIDSALKETAAYATADKSFGSAVGPASSPSSENLRGFARQLEECLNLIHDVDLRSAAINLIVDIRAGAGPGIVPETVRVGVLAQLQSLLVINDVPFPPYNHLRAYEASTRPWCQPVRLPLRMSRQKHQLFGIPVDLPIGIASSPLTRNSEWVDYCLGSGYNVLTYKTVRSAPHDPFPFPNWLVMQDEEHGNKPWSLVRKTDFRKVLANLKFWPTDHEFSMVNSFGVPSAGPEVWVPDVKECLKRLPVGRLLIVSVMGSPEVHTSDEGLVEDFVNVSQMAESADASVIELNLSCPATLKDTMINDANFLYGSDPEGLVELIKRVKRALRPETKLVLKFGYLPEAKLRLVLEPLVADIDGVSGINAMQWPVISEAVLDDDDYKAAFPPPDGATEISRLSSAVSGVAIQNYARSFIRSLVSLRHELGGRFEIIGMGGVMDSEDAAGYFKLGASAVQMVTAPLLNPQLAYEMHDFFAEAPIRQTKASRIAR